MIAGTVGEKPRLRLTPAGIPIIRFPLRHESNQVEAGMRRNAACTVTVVAVGETLRGSAGLNEGSRVRVTGFIARDSERGVGEYRLVLHAHSVETLTA